MSAKEIPWSKSVFVVDQKFIRVVTLKKWELQEHSKTLSEKKLCFNCTGIQHRTSVCKSKRMCQMCQRKHHKKQYGNMMLPRENLVIHPAVLLNVNNMACCAVLHTDAASCYASAALLNRLKVIPIQKEIKNTGIVMTSTRSDLPGKLNLNSKVKCKRNTLLSLPNQKYEKIIEQHQHLRGINMNQWNRNPDPPMNMVLGTSDYAWIKV